MKLPSLKSIHQKDSTTAKTFDITIQVQATGEGQAREMQEAIQSFVSHFSVAEMKSAAHKLKSPGNRKMIKTFL